MILSPIIEDLAWNLCHSFHNFKDYYLWGEGELRSSFGSIVCAYMDTSKTSKTPSNHECACDVGTCEDLITSLQLDDFLS